MPWNKTDKQYHSDILRMCRKGNNPHVCPRVARKLVNEARRKRALAALEGLAKADPVLVRGFREGRKTWIDVYPPGGKRMRVTHEVLAGLRSIPPPIPPQAKRKCIAWRYVGSSRRCAIYANETGYRAPKPPLKLRPLEGIFS